MNRLLLSLLLALTSCASVGQYSGYEKELLGSNKDLRGYVITLNSYVGQPVSLLKEKWGNPSEVLELESGGNDIYIYSFSRTVMYSNFNDRAHYTYTEVQRYLCITKVYVDHKTSLITKWTSTGNACRA